jgi:DNA-binding response OmpR family regulator
MAMDLLAVYPDPAPPELARTLDLGGYRWKAIGSLDDAAEHEPSDGWAGVVVVLDDDSESAWAFCRSVRKRDTGTRILVMVPGTQMAALELRDELFDDFIISPFHPVEMEARLRHLLARNPGEVRAQLVEYSGLVLNLETYQASIDGRPLDLTYMEYELLKFLAHNPGKVFTREVLLSRVWGYEYYGGARTVDVHIRRLRAKLGEEYAGLIHTVRSVGYRFGQTRWGS